MKLLVDLHLHLSLPWLGSMYTRYLHGFPGPEFPTGYRRLIMLSFYQLCLPSKSVAFSTFRRNLRLVQSRYRRDIITDRAGLDRFLTNLNSTFALISSVESFRMLENPNDVLWLYDQGVRSFQPIHFFDNDYGHSYRMGLIEPSKRGLTGPGKKVISLLAERGAVLDIAHMNVRTMEEILDLYPGPVICSHTGLTNIRETTRNLPPHLAKALFARGGTVGVTPWRRLLERGTPGDLARWTASYIRTVLGFVECGGEKGVAIGSDRGAPLLIHPAFFSKRNLETMMGLFLREGLGQNFSDDFFAGNALRILQGGLR